MTLTHILPTLRASVPDPFGRDLWPEFTTASVDDVTVAGVSLTCLAGWCGTPCVHTAAAVIPGTGGMPSPTDIASVVVTRVIQINTASDGVLDVWIDARLAGADIEIGELRMIGRVSTAGDARARIHPAGEAAGPRHVDAVVSDLRAGDLLVLPCRGAALLREVDPRRRHRPEHQDAAPWTSAVCGR